LQQAHFQQWVRYLKDNAGASQPHVCRDAVVESLAMSGIFNTIPQLLLHGGSTSTHPEWWCDVVVDCLQITTALMQDEYQEVRDKMSATLSRQLCAQDAKPTPTSPSPLVTRGQGVSAVGRMPLHEQVVLERVYATLSLLAQVPQAHPPCWSPTKSNTHRRSWPAFRPEVFVAHAIVKCKTKAPIKETPWTQAFCLWAFTWARKWDGGLVSRRVNSFPIMLAPVLPKLRTPDCALQFCPVVIQTKTVLGFLRFLSI
jgi:hypothetical protein